MHAELKAKWVAALREPDRKQIKGALHSSNGQCCLGVLCEIVVAEGLIPGLVVDRHDTGFVDVAPVDATWIVTYDDQASVLPPEIAELTGLTCTATIPSDSGKTLAGLNDIGRTFAQIADIIEEEF